MSAEERYNINVMGEGSVSVVLAHGYGCDQSMWRFIAPALARKYKVVLFDYTGCGKSDINQYDSSKYSTLTGYASDLVDIVDEMGGNPMVLVGHSVSGMIGLLADKMRPGIFDAHVMIGPSPSYINNGAYVGGFDRGDIDELLTTLEGNYLGWSSNMAPAIMGAPEQPELADELINSFCRTDPTIAARFARATFLSDNLADLPNLDAPTLILQSTEDIIAPVSVGEYMRDAMPNATLRLVRNIGHCPHLSEPEACLREILTFLDELALERTVA